MNLISSIINFSYIKISYIIIHILKSYIKIWKYNNKILFWFESFLKKRNFLILFKQIFVIILWLLDK